MSCTNILVKAPVLTSIIKRREQKLSVSKSTMFHKGSYLNNKSCVKHNDVFLKDFLCELLLQFIKPIQGVEIIHECLSFIHVIVNYVNFTNNYSFFQSSINEEMSFGTYRGLILRSQLIVLLKQRVKTPLSSYSNTK